MIKCLYASNPKLLTLPAPEGFLFEKVSQKLNIYLTFGFHNRSIKEEIMLKLTDITKDYQVAGNPVQALKGINLEFRQSEFVSILGPSGCGKTTMLNLIGGLDAYTTGDLLIEGKSTKEFKHKDWDAYRNKTIGFVFQAYNLIGHQTILDNVAIALTLSGVSASERKARATEALEKVGLGDQLNKKPNQLSGGQMQRVAIARALVSNPKIIMADEPTGALDSKTSVQIMELLKEISQDRLVIMVTHNPELAKEYSSRIINLFDGLVVSDSNPVTKQELRKAEKQEATEEEVCEKMVNKRTAMSFWTATKLSFKNLLTKKKRTILTSIAGSIGIMGVALVLAISSGMGAYTDSLQREMANHPLVISRDVLQARQGGPAWMHDIDTTGQFPSGNEIIMGDAEADNIQHRNIITQNFVDYLQTNVADTNLGVVTFSHGMEMNVLANNDQLRRINTTQGRNVMGMTLGGQSHFHQLPDNRDFILEQYDLLHGTFPTNENELVLVVDSFNRIDISMLNDFGITPSETFQFSQFMGMEFRVVTNNDFFQPVGPTFQPRTVNQTMWDAVPVTHRLTIVGIMRVKECAPTEMLSHGLHHTTELTQKMLLDAQASDIALAQTANETINIFTGQPFNPLNPLVTFDSVMLAIGAETMPTGVQIFPSSFAARGQIRDLIRAYNAGRPEAERIIYTDPSAEMVARFNEMVGLITIILTAVAALALIVSTIMIGIITYVSVVERTKEIGILRAIGARKKDVTRIFNAETLMIGFVSGTVGIVLALLLSIPLNLVIGNMMGVSGIVVLPFYFAFALIAGSMALTLLGGLIPARGAAKKDPVLALRAE